MSRLSSIACRGQSMQTTDKLNPRSSAGDSTEKTPDHTSQSDRLSYLCKKIVLQALKDLSLSDIRTVQEVTSYVRGEYISKHIQQAQLPPQLHNAMLEIATMSAVQRPVAVKEVFQALKKTPSEGGFK